MAAAFQNSNEQTARFEVRGCGSVVSKSALPSRNKIEQAIPRQRGVRADQLEHILGKEADL